MKTITIRNAAGASTPVISMVKKHKIIVGSSSVDVVTYYFQANTIPLPSVGNTYNIRYEYFNGATWVIFVQGVYDSNGNGTGIGNIGTTGNLYECSFSNVNSVPLNTLFRATILSQNLPTVIVLTTSNTMPLVL